MKSKMFEIRDRATCIPVIAIKTEADTLGELAHFRKAGWGASSIILIKHGGGDIFATHNAYSHSNQRTMGTAHRYIEEHYDDIPNYAVIDVEYILGEVDRPKESEIGLGYMLSEVDSPKESEIEKWEWVD